MPGFIVLGQDQTLKHHDLNYISELPLCLSYFSQKPSGQKQGFIFIFQILKAITEKYSKE
jgi:hypothetical protein